ncbi:MULTISPECIES: metallophosphoesterase family protein [unclassified Mesorhizobium]|uniref:metallophosphoesterase family protein n=1 Tax=unclassified Mesorhizobium TaxID=325217 RepID=UPI000FCA15F2|nr:MULTISPECIES: metallophosphoesterase family protein [unclassified Mesorhizobium]RUU67959.1 serine/threonine protein phosphatase [Mesorhizobium sp. M7A.T.Ca.TU.009.01.1.1]RUT89997.1 serine/threonine protein phosphatase [Mesorhizobium sp. M7A.T.Ca.US.000.02.1.1]RUT90096.1 serine/threonine protein phosphatase [Mesorhizobium sp. M7A.T.Ca.US.000.02.2.1]RUU02685.1 serine/threonine protein phosphatase [Mesorhizobium sp. M7A.T.Ca.TU.009.02.1.1]RWN35323.1 MAG: serine/threonine protein phosphatase [M
MTLFQRKPRIAARARLDIDMQDAVVYAIGDVHGCYKELRALEQKILLDSLRFQGHKIIVMLGDYIDRGLQSARVLDHLLAPPPKGFQRICLAGNHEVAMLNYLDGNLSREPWLATGGLQTLFSYGIDPARLASLYGSSAQIDRRIREIIPDDHVSFLRGLPIMVRSRKFVFVHAGIRPGVDLAAQTDHDLANIRSDFFEATHLLDRWVVHGHTPVDVPKLEGRRLGIDTAAFQSGRLTAVRIADKQGRLIFS